MTYVHMHDGEQVLYENECPVCEVNPQLMSNLYGKYPQEEKTMPYDIDIVEQTEVTHVELHMSPETAKHLCSALYRMQSYHVNQGAGIPASGRSRYPDLAPLFQLYDQLAAKGYE